MAIPALKRPKVVINLDKIEKSHTNVPHSKHYVIITLKSDKKLVVTLDSYHGIISTGDALKCIFCGGLLALDHLTKEKHLQSDNHNIALERHPHLEEFSHNLIRKLDNNTTYCTICNVVVENMKLTQHISSESHLQELERATTRAVTYKPSQ